MEENNDVESPPELEDKYKIGLIPEVKAKLGTSISLLDTQYAHVAKNMTIYWGRAQFYEYVEELLLYSPTSVRPKREGFHDDAVNEIFLVIKLHDTLFPELRK